MKTFERYSAFTNIELLRKYSLKPLRKSKRVNTTKISIKKFEQYAASRGWSLERIPWCPEGFFIGCGSICNFSC
jgi:16S rRNA C967 or C1407 C5-methylase (RsmB/RsmF family)